MYFTAFLLVFGIWRQHTLLFDRLEVHDESVLWLNLLLLLITTFAPYPLTILGDFPANSDAMLLCVVTFFLIAAVQCTLVVRWMCPSHLPPSTSPSACPCAPPISHLFSRLRWARGLWVARNRIRRPNFGALCLITLCEFWAG